MTPPASVRDLLVSEQSLTDIWVPNQLPTPGPLRESLKTVLVKVQCAYKSPGEPVTEQDRGQGFYTQHSSQAQRGHSPRVWPRLPSRTSWHRLLSSQGPTGPSRPGFPPETPGCPAFLPATCPGPGREDFTVLQVPQFDNSLLCFSVKKGNAISSIKCFLMPASPCTNAGTQAGKGPHSYSTNVETQA